MVILSMFASIYFTFNAVEIQDPNQTWIIRKQTSVNQNGDIAIMIGPPSETFKRDAPVPWETYAVILKHHESKKDIYFVAESKGVQALTWRDRNGKQSLTTISAPIVPDVSQWLDIAFGDKGYEVTENILPQDVVPYELSWNADGNTLVFGLTQFPTTQSFSLENYLAIYSGDFSKASHVKFPGLPKMIVWRDISSFYAQAGDAIYLVDLTREPLVPKMVLNRPSVTFHDYKDGMLIYSDGNDLFWHEKMIYRFHGIQIKICIDFPFLAVQDEKTVVVMDLKNDRRKSLPLNDDDVLIGIYAARKTLFVRRGPTAIDTISYLEDDWQRDNLFEISDVFADGWPLRE